MQPPRSSRARLSRPKMQGMRCGLPDIPYILLSGRGNVSLFQKSILRPPLRFFRIRLSRRTGTEGLASSLFFDSSPHFVFYIIKVKSGLCQQTKKEKCRKKLFYDQFLQFFIVFTDYLPFLFDYAVVSRFSLPRRAPPSADNNKRKRPESVSPFKYAEIKCRRPSKQRTSANYFRRPRARVRAE